MQGRVGDYQSPKRSACASITRGFPARKEARQAFSPSLQTAKAKLQRVPHCKITAENSCGGAPALLAGLSPSVPGQPRARTLTGPSPSGGSRGGAEADNQLRPPRLESKRVPEYRFIDKFGEQLIVRVHRAVRYE
jgi:hypothetical protein